MYLIVEFFWNLLIVIYGVNIFFYLCFLKLVCSIYIGLCNVNYNLFDFV